MQHKASEMLWFSFLCRIQPNIAIYRPTAPSTQTVLRTTASKLNNVLLFAYSGFNPRGPTGGQMPPQGFQLPPQAYDTINNPSPTLPNVPPPPKFLQLLILPPQGLMSTLNPVTCVRAIITGLHVFVRANEQHCSLQTQLILYV